MRSAPTNLSGAPWIAVLRPGARRQGRPRRRPARAAAGHRPADARQGRVGRARGRPVRVLARRRRPARRPGPGRRRRQRRLAQHPAARRPGRPGRRGRGRVSAVVGLGAARASAGAGRRRIRLGVARHRLAAAAGRARRRSGSPVYGAHRRRCSACSCRWSRRLAGLAVVGRRRARRPSLRPTRLGAALLLALPPRPSSRSCVLRRADLASVVRLLGHRPARRATTRCAAASAGRSGRPSG